MNLGMNGSGIFGDFGIFPMMPITVPGEEPLFDEAEGQEEKNYLQKGEKILTLLRERESRPFLKDTVLEMVKKRWELTQNAAAKKIGETLEVEFLSFLKSSPVNPEELEEACAFLQTKLPAGVSLLVEDRLRERSLANSLCEYRNKEVVNLRYGYEDVVLPVGAPFKKKFEGGCRFKSERTMPLVNTRIFTRFMGEMYLRNYLLQTLRKLRAGGSEKYRSHRVIGYLQERERSRRGFNESYPCMKQEIDESYRSTESYFRMLLFYPETPEAEKAVLYIGVWDLQDVLWRLKEDYESRRREARMERELSKDHALSFQDKKNIPYKTVRAMRNSGFNDFFGYVEFDELCDLSLTEEIFREYRAFAEELGISKYPEVSLRFRRLGNHKASGLYYPALKCLCVDLRSPKSMVHEVGHMIDYHLDHISITYEFQPVYKKYEELLRGEMNKDKSVSAVLKGKSKYNLEYYLQETEVFARCFEMYVVHVRQIDNSLCRPESFAYPKDDKLIELIRKFYDGILVIGEMEEKA